VDSPIIHPWVLSLMRFTALSLARLPTGRYSSHNRSDEADNAQYWTVRQSQEYKKPTSVSPPSPPLSFQLTHTLKLY